MTKGTVFTIWGNHTGKITYQDNGVRVIQNNNKGTKIFLPYSSIQWINEGNYGADSPYIPEEEKE